MGASDKWSYWREVKKWKRAGKWNRRMSTGRLMGTLLYRETWNRRWLFNLPVITPWLPLHTNRAACLRSGRRPSSLSFLAQQLATPPRRLDFLERRYIYKIEKLFEYICIYTLPVRFSATSHIPYTLHSI